MAVVALCVECQTRPRRSAHRNTQYCAPCQQQLLKAPRSRVTAAQAAQIETLRNTIPRREIAARVGITQARLHRYLTEQGLRSNARDYPPDVVQTVCATYAALGKRKTQDLFPDVVVRCIVERYREYAPRQIRWTGEQQLEAVRMAGLVSHTAQARYFGRPNAFEGSIKSFWAKTMGCPPKDVHGLGFTVAWQLATAGTPATLVTQAAQSCPHAVVLWLDLVPHLRPGVAPEVRQMVEVLARFQAWVFGSIDTAVIRHMIAEREAYGREDGRRRERRAHPGAGLAPAGGDL